MHRSSSIWHINLLQEYLNLFPELSWSTPDDERINIPGVVLDRNWSYRFRPTIAQITNHEALAQVMHYLAST
jgi:4-alpha-glucanotransferase